MELHKIAIKVEGRKGDKNWVHFCYIPPELKDEFDSKVEADPRWVIKWANEDFGMGIGEVMTEIELDQLRELIKERYQRLYPDLYIESQTDNQGWVRVWMISNMRSEIAKRG